MISEIGGIGWATEGGWSYGNGPKTLEEFYDRKPKFDAKKLHAITARQAAYERNEPVAPQPAVKTIDAKWQLLIGAVRDGNLSTPHKYVT